MIDAFSFFIFCSPFLSLFFLWACFFYIISMTGLYFGTFRYQPFLSVCNEKNEMDREIRKIALVSMFICLLYPILVVHECLIYQ